MKILWIKAGGLVPADTGGKIRSYNILRELARRHSISLFSFYGEHENDCHSELRGYFESVVCVPLKLPERRSLAAMKDYGLALFSSLPYNISRFCRPEVRRELSGVLRARAYDAIVCDFLVPAPLIPWDYPCPKIIFTHNVEATIWRRHYEVASNPAWKTLSWFEWRRTLRAERKYLQLADHVLAVSETDRDHFLQLLQPESVTVIPTGVDVEYFHPVATQEAQQSLVFTGSMDWLPNEDAALYFMDKILPLIRREFPSAPFSIVGRKPSARLRAVCEKDHNVQLTGRVEDVRPYLAQAAVCVVPLRIGGGTRLKIFEAMSMGKAVVSTTIGAEGLPVRDGEHLLLADDCSAFAEAVAGLLRDSERRRRIGLTARRLVEEKYCWARVAEAFSNALTDVVSKWRCHRSDRFRDTVQAASGPNPVNR